MESVPVTRTAPSASIHTHLESLSPRGLCVLHLGSILLAQELGLNHPGAHTGLVHSMVPTLWCPQGPRTLHAPSKHLFNY